MSDGNNTSCLARLARAFLPFGICGLVGVLVDLDHLIPVIKLLLAGQAPTWGDIGGRALHIPVLVGSGIICGSVCSFSLGQLFLGWMKASGYWSYRK